jgi:hypothetical protein
MHASAQGQLLLLMLGGKQEFAVPHHCAGTGIQRFAKQKNS